MEETKNVSRSNTGNVFCVMISFAMLLLCCYTIIQERKISGTLKDLEFRIIAAEQTSTRRTRTRTKTISVPLSKMSDELNRNRYEFEKIVTDLKKTVKLIEGANACNRIELRRAIKRVRILEVNHMNQQKLRKRRSAEKADNATANLWKVFLPVTLLANGKLSSKMIVTLKGPPGEKGSPGKRGPKGERGRRGKAGPRGLKGSKGDMGVHGPAGPTGRQGQKGDRGNPGLKGQKGERGLSVSVPKVVIPPVNKTVLSSGFATFTCEAVGNPQPEIALVPKGKKWNERYERFGKGTLSIRNVKFSDRGEIECVAKSVLGEDRRIAQLTVHVKAKAAIKKNKIETESGYNVVIDCEVEGFPKPTVSWERIGEILPSKAVLADNGKTLKLTDVGQKDGGDYVCQAKNFLATSKSLVSVVVFERLKFLNKLNPLTFVKAYLTFKITCLYSGGIQPINISWKRKGKKLPKNVIFSQNNQTLEIRNFQVEDVGTYLCNVRSVMSEISQQTEFVYTNLYFQTCKILRDHGVSESGNYLINPSGDLSQKPVQVYCDMNSKLGRGVTLVSHDSEARTRVDGLEVKGQYKRPVNYNMPNAQMQALKRLSNQCDQFIKYDCVGSVLYLHGGSHQFAWWVSFNGRKMQNWGGVRYPNKGCACTLDKSCPGSDTCYCDINTSDKMRTDSGYLQDKEFLPVKELRFGDTGDSNEHGFHTLGKLRCY